MDSKFLGPCPQEFESPQCRFAVAAAAAASAAAAVAAAVGAAAANMRTRPCSTATAATVHYTSRTRNLNAMEIFSCLLADLLAAVS